MNIFLLILSFCIVVLLLWNIRDFIYHKKIFNREREYYQLEARLNFITATGSICILVIAYLGWNAQSEITKKNDKSIADMLREKSKPIDSLYNNLDSLVQSKDILKAGIYIVTNQYFDEKRIYMFENLRTIDNKSLPKFKSPPKLLITTNTGENLRIKEVTDKYFILGRPITKDIGLAISGDNPAYPQKLVFDVWIGEYK